MRTCVQAWRPPSGGAPWSTSKARVEVRVMGKGSSKAPSCPCWGEKLFSVRGEFFFRVLGGGRG